MEHVMTQEEWEAKMGQKVLEQTRSEIYLELRFFGIALSALTPDAKPSLSALATDGNGLYYSPIHIINVFRHNPKFLDRAYLHVILHCIFSHLWIGGKRDRMLWGLACDIAVEYTIDAMDKKCTKRILSWQRQKMYERLKNEQIFSAAQIYRMLQKEPAEEIRQLTAEFYTDDHCFWPKQEDGTAIPKPVQEAAERWQKIARQTRIQQERQEDGEREQETLFAAQLRASRNRRSYGEFLRKFAVRREELHIDPEEFDLNYYTYGLKLYGNMPLIEPLESRETEKIREFVIAVDTSYSTSGELVSHFLEETFDILSREEHFFGDARVRLLQCDDRVRRDIEIKNRTQLEQLVAAFAEADRTHTAIVDNEAGIDKGDCGLIAGGGGTDFRPVFAYIEELLAQGELKNLCGLLYFTDGKGVYPKKRPNYKTAFLFLGDYDETAVPPWAMQMRLEPEE